MKNYIQRGDVMPFTAAANQSGGDPVIVGGLAGVVQADVLSGETGQLLLEGVCALPKAGVTIAEGVVLNVAAGVVTTAAGTKIGHAWNAAAIGAATVGVKLSR